MISLEGCVLVLGYWNLKRDLDLEVVGDLMERGLRQTNEQDNSKACSLASWHTNLRNKDVAEIDAPRLKDFHLNTPPPL